jgi:hypothetical protein
VYSHRMERAAEIVATVGLAGWIDFLFTIEWSYPYCTQPEDGPAYPVLGFPLPYAVPSHASSLEFSFMPHVFVLNLLLISLLLFPIIRTLHRGIRHKVALRRWVVRVASVLLVGLCFIRGLSFTFGHPVASIGSAWLPYRDLRPVGLSSSYLVHSKGNCTPSAFWFPDGWIHN